jgi:hypothetical protein
MPLPKKTLREIEKKNFENRIEWLEKNMKIELSKSDLKEFLWLQNEIETILVNETLRRAIKKGILPEDANYLYKEEVSSEYGEITVKHLCKSQKTSQYEEYWESYTLKEALQITIGLAPKT